LCPSSAASPQGRSWTFSEPAGALLDLPVAETLPAVRRRLENLAKLDEVKRAALIGKLAEVLGVRWPMVRD
jgi:hypothetical protein